MEQYSEQFIRKIRKYYSITVPVILCISLGITILTMANSMPERRLMMQLRRAKNLSQIEAILQKSNCRLSDDRMAEVYFNCALGTFARKDYQESFRLLRKVLNSEAHVDFKATAQFELANAYFLAGQFQEGLAELDALIKAPETPQDIREKAVLLQQRVGAGAL